MTEVEIEGSVLGQWRELTEDDQLYCVLFSGEGEAHTNEEYCRRMPYKKRMFYGDATLALMFNDMLNHPSFPFTDVVVETIDVKYTDRLFVGDRVRTAFRIEHQFPDSDVSDRRRVRVSLYGLGEDAVAMRSSLVLHGTANQDGNQNV